MKRFMVLALMMILVGMLSMSRRAVAQFDPEASGAYFKGGVAGAREVWRAVSWFRGIYPHQWWVIQYADGFCLFNRFRAKRGPDDVFSHATGHGDCDWWFWPEHAPDNHVCLTSPFDAERIADEHGGIVSIRPIDHPGVLYGE